MNRPLRGACASLFYVLAALPLCAYAHHALDNATPGNLVEGFISGLAHPVIGVDHLLFVVAVGIAGYYFGRVLASTVAFAVGALAGTAVHLNNADIPYPDAWIAVSLVALGVLLFRRSEILRSKIAVAIFAAIGIVHGYAYGESIVGAETTPLVAYLSGFTIVQVAIALAAYAVARYIDRARPAAATLKVAGSGLAIAGAAFLFLAIAA